MSLYTAKFNRHPDQDPATGKTIEIGCDKFKKLTKKYGTPKIKSPKTGALIGVNKRNYRTLRKEGYSDHELLYGKLEEYHELPEEIINIITKDVNSPSKRLINKQYKEYPTYDVPELPKELIDEITKNVNLPVKRLINKQFLLEKQPEYNKSVLDKIYQFVIKNDDFTHSDYGYMTKDEFQEEQWVKILKLKPDELLFVNILIKNINHGKLESIRDDYSAMGDIIGFFFKDGKIVLRYD
jgi:hypothetical protein